MPSGSRPRSELRLFLGSAAVLSVADAVRLLPWRDAEARAWLERRHLVLRRPGLPAPTVRWADVLETLGEVTDPGHRA